MSAPASPDAGAGQPAAGASPPEPLRSVHTSNVPELLERLGISLLVTTYQANQLIVCRASGGVLNTHFRAFSKPMGMAVAPNRLAIGGLHSVWEFHNQPGACASLNERDPSVAHDAVYLPRLTHWTGDIAVHEMAWVNGELIVVNTRFSCLARRSPEFNFEPVWTPPFISAVRPGDCCHLNGIGLRDGQIRYATALGATDTAGGWRANKKDGGLLMEVPSGEVLLDRLSMPHSPRWYQGRLWLLESGRGRFGYVDLEAGRYVALTELAGFTRGLCFVGNLAIVGLSQVRESAVFGGVPIAERALEERICGVWLIDIRSGDVVGFIRFEEAVQEIFAVEALAWRYPEVVVDDVPLLSNTFALQDDVLAGIAASEDAGSAAVPDKSAGAS